MALKTKVATALPIEFSEVCEVVYEDITASTNGRSLSGAFTQAGIQGGTFDATYESINGYHSSLQNFRGYSHSVNTEEHLPAGTITTSEVGNNFNWVNIDNIKTLSTSTFAYSDMDSTLGTDYLRSDNFNFNLPTSAIVKGIELKVMRKATTNGTIKDGFTTLRLGSPVGDNKALATPYTTSWSEITYGGPTDLWGLSWTYADINASYFGCSIRPVQPGPAYLQRVQVAYVQLKVYYTI